MVFGGSQSGADEYATPGESHINSDSFISGNTRLQIEAGRQILPV